MHYFISLSIRSLKLKFRVAAFWLAIAFSLFAPAKAALITQDSGAIDGNATKIANMNPMPSEVISLGKFEILDPNATAITDVPTFKWAVFSRDWADFTKDLDEAFARQAPGRSDASLLIDGDIKIDRTSDQVDFESATLGFGVFAAMNEMEKRVAHAIIADDFYQSHIKPLKNNHLMVESTPYRSDARQHSILLDKIIYRLTNGLTYTDMFVLLLTLLSLHTLSKILSKRI